MMTKAKTILMVILGGLFLVPMAGRSQESATASVEATIIIPVTATESSQLNFGRFFPGSAGGTIEISPTGSVQTSSTVVVDASPRNPGSFSVTGELDATITISLPDGPTTLINEEASKTMQVDGWSTYPPNAEAGIKLEGGAQTVMIGARLRVGPIEENPRGIYTGSYQVTFSYN